MAARSRMGMDMPLSPSPSPPPQPGPAGADASGAGAAAGAAPGASAPVAQEAAPQQDPQEATREELEKRVRRVIEQFFDIAKRAADVPEGGEGALASKIQETVASLADLMAIAPALTAEIPFEVLEHIDIGRNPDLQTLSLVRRLANDNQQMLGQNMALGHYCDQLSAALSANFPDLAPHVAVEQAQPSRLA